MGERRPHPSKSGSMRRDAQTIWRHPTGPQGKGTHAFSCCMLHVHVCARTCVRACADHPHVGEDVGVRVEGALLGVKRPEHCRAERERGRGNGAGPFNQRHVANAPLPAGMSIFIHTPSQGL